MLYQNSFFFNHLAAVIVKRKSDDSLEENKKQQCDDNGKHWLCSYIDENYQPPIIIDHRSYNTQDANYHSQTSWDDNKNTIRKHAKKLIQSSSKIIILSVWGNLFELSKKFDLYNREQIYFNILTRNCTDIIIHALEECGVNISSSDWLPTLPTNIFNQLADIEKLHAEIPAI